MTNRLMTLLAATATAAFFAIAATGPALAAPALQVADTAPTYGTPYDVRITGLAPGQKVRLIADRENYCGLPIFMQSVNTFTASADGTVDLAKVAPLEGSYAAADAAGPFWSMAPAKDVKASGGPERLSIAMDVDGDGSVEQRVALQPSRTLSRAKMIDPGPNFPGATLYVPAGVKRAPVVISLGGSEGGNMCAEGSAARFVDRGIAVFRMPYYSPNNRFTRKPDIPELPIAFADIPVDRLEQARDWLRSRPEVDGSRLGIFGVSKGAEMALLGASLIEGFGPVAAIVPSDVVWEGWGKGVAEGQRSSFSWRGKPLPFVPYEGMTTEIAKYAKQEPVRIRTPHDAGRAAHPERIAPARIAVERIKGPLLVAGGDKDDTWNSGYMTRLIAERRQQAGLQTIALAYPEGTHHLSGGRMEPTEPGSAAASAEVFDRAMAMFQEAFGRK